MTSLNNLGHLHMWLGELEEAERCWREALVGCEQELGPDHDLTLVVSGNLANVLDARGDHAGAERHLRDHLERCTRLLGPTDESTTTTLQNLGTMLCQQGRSEEGRRLLDDAVERLRMATLIRTPCGPSSTSPTF